MNAKYQAQFGLQRLLVTLQQFFSLPNLFFLFSELSASPLKLWRSMFLLGSNMMPTDSSVSILVLSLWPYLWRSWNVQKMGPCHRTWVRGSQALSIRSWLYFLPEFSLIFDPLRHKLSNGSHQQKPNCSICPGCPVIPVVANCLYKLQVTTNLFHHKLLLFYMRFFTVLS